MAVLALRNCVFVPDLTEGYSGTEGDLLFRGGKIDRIAPQGAAFEGVDQELDAGGMTALPGIIDGHIHLTSTRDIPAESCFVDPCTRTLEALSFAQYLLSIGVTTVRDCGEDRDFAVSALKNAVESGLVEGPHILACGITLTPTDTGTTPDSDFGFMLPYNVDSPAAMRAAARRNIAKGADFLKLYGSGSMMAKGGDPGRSIMADDEILEAVSVARQKKTYCAIHAHSNEAIRQALLCGVDTIEHASFIEEDSLELLAGSGRRGIVPTMGIDAAILQADPATEYGKQVIQKMLPLLEKIKSHLAAAYERGDILIGWGTDAPLSAYRADPGLEFRMRSEFLGWKSIDILKQATINTAKLCRLDDQLGTLKEGKQADVILVPGDPVTDISVLYAGAAHVFKAGKQYK